jgi:hypothetical protein
MAPKTVATYNRDFLTKDLQYVLIHMRNITLPRRRADGESLKKDDLINLAMDWDQQHPNDADTAYEEAKAACKAKNAERDRQLVNAAQAAQDAVVTKTAKTKRERAAKAKKADAAAKASKFMGTTKATKVVTFAIPARSTRSTRSTKVPKPAMIDEQAEDREEDIDVENNDSLTEPEPAQEPLPPWLKRALFKKNAEWEGLLNLATTRADIDAADLADEELIGMQGWAMTINREEYDELALGKNGYQKGPWMGS